MHAEGFGAFSASAVVAHGTAVAFKYPSGSRYVVPLGYILSWFDDLEAEGLEIEDTLLVVRSRRFYGGHLVRVYLSDGRHYDVAWDTVLMACEPGYEHYGGLTNASKELAKSWFKKLQEIREK